MVPTFRVINAVLGLVLAPLLLVLLVGWGLLRWRRTGRDPVYLDDPSILMPAPPPGLTPAAGAAVRDGGVDRRALTAASLDLASRGQIGVQGGAERRVCSRPARRSASTRATPSPATRPSRRACCGLGRGPPTTRRCTCWAGSRRIGGAHGYIEPEDITKLGEHVGEFNKRLETHLVAQSWFRERPSAVIGRWSGGAALVLIGGIATLIAGVILPSSGLVLVAVALVISADRAVRHRARDARPDAGTGP